MMDFDAPTLLCTLFSLTLPFLLFHAWLLYSLSLLSLHLCLHNFLHHVEASQTFLLCLHTLKEVEQYALRPAAAVLHMEGAFLGFLHELHSSNQIVLQLQDRRLTQVPHPS